MNNGWIKLHRQLLDNPVIMKDADHLAIWCYLLLKATHDEYDVVFGGRRITLRAGEFVTGRKKIAADLRVSESKVERVLKCFIFEQQIEQQTDNHSRILKLKGWGRYQHSEQRDGQPSDSSRTATEQQVDTNKKDKNENNGNNGKKPDGGTVPELIDPMEAELRTLIGWLNRTRLLGSEKSFTVAALRKYKARRENWSARQIAEAFDNLKREPDRWKIRNNGYQPLSWWLEKDDRIEGMLNCHLKGSSKAAFIS